MQMQMENLKIGAINQDKTCIIMLGEQSNQEIDNMLSIDYEQLCRLIYTFWENNLQTSVVACDKESNHQHDGIAIFDRIINGFRTSQRFYGKKYAINFVDKKLEPKISICFEPEFFLKLFNNINSNYFTISRLNGERNITIEYPNKNLGCIDSITLSTEINSVTVDANDLTEYKAEYNKEIFDMFSKLHCALDKGKMQIYMNMYDDYTIIKYIHPKLPIINIIAINTTKNIIAMIDTTKNLTDKTHVTKNGAFQFTIEKLLLIGGIMFLVLFLLNVCDIFYH